MYVINDDTSFNELKSMIDSKEAELINSSDNIVDVLIDKKLIQIELGDKYKKLLIQKTPESSLDDLIYGKDKTEKIVNISIIDDEIHTFIRQDGVIGKTISPFKHWILSPNDYSGFSSLSGRQHYKYIKLFNNEEFEEVRSKVYQKDLFTIWNKAENYMIYSGATYFKNLKPEELHVLSFDIETSGLIKESNDACVYLITNTLRANGSELRKTFCLTGYQDQQDMIHDWCLWVNEVNPDLLLGHNIVIYDLPYLDFQYKKKYKTNLPLGRDGVKLNFAEKTSEFRKDGSQSYSYHRIECYGREIVDTFFLAIKSDVARKYESYGLKAIVRQEGLEKPGRSFIDAGKIKEYYNNRAADPETWNKVVRYAEEDSDDSLKLFDLMIPPFFYFTSHIPKTFQQMMESATGSQINSFLIRGYLQNGGSIPKATKLTETVKGGTSFAVPGVYRNLLKVDLKSCYPSQVLRFKLYDKIKDPEQYFYKMVHYFTYERFDLKKKYKETGDKYYYHREQTSKVFINSAYGVTNTNGLNFNSPKIAEKITYESRKVIDFALRWASGEGRNYWMKKFKEAIGEDYDGDENYES